jgi:lysophospholipase L1-like esterase
MILINGCSFTEGYDLDNPDDNWPTQYGRLVDQPVTSLALGGSSNDRIYRTTKEWLVNNTQPSHIIIGWTFFNRNELFHHEGMYIRGLNTGSDSEIEYKPLDIDIVHKNWIQYNLNEWINYRNWIYNVLFLQQYCESNNIQYTFFNAVENPLFDEFINGTDKALELADQAWQWRDKKKYKAERTIHDQYKELVALANKINLSNWVLPDSSMAEYVSNQGFKTDQTGHFYADGYRAWAEYLVDNT